ncbi:MAG: cation-translocating P-type ATPase [Verrucomicrobia subdivision 3 bacterium]|nr:cation-translocating P-type ATPase [Limisphaerales bacterium]
MKSDAQAVFDRCAYCDAPLPEETVCNQTNCCATSAKYCCYGCRLLGESGSKSRDENTSERSPWFKVGIGAAIAGQAMLLGLAVNLTPPEGLARWVLHLALMASSVAVLAVLGGPLFAAAWEAVRARRITIELLFLSGIVGALGASLYSTFTGIGAVYYEVVAVLLTVYAVGKTLGAQSRVRAIAESRKLLDTFDTCRIVDSDGHTKTCRVADIAPGNTVLVHAGEPIPIDGQILTGEAFVRETPLTGEPFAVVRRAGDFVFAGSFSEDGDLRILATSLGRTRRLDQLVALTHAAQQTPSRLQAEADRIVRWFLPLVLLVAAATFAFWTWRAGWSTGLFNSLAVLLVACPCAMGLATPIALWNALARLAERGLAPRNSDVIARLADASHVVFDKTGTLSEEELSLIDLAVAETSMSRGVLGDVLRALAQRAPHPVSRAFARLESAGASVAFKSIKPVPAKGIEAWIELGDGSELHLRVGQRDFVGDAQGETRLLTQLRNQPGDHLVYVAIDGQLTAVCAVRERLRNSATETVARLQQLGVATSVLTGDRPERAAGLGLAQAEGGLTPEDKSQRVARLRAVGQTVVFVGDGVNDAPALRAANLGIALDHGAGLATANADAVLYGGDLTVLPWAIQFARHVRQGIRANLIFAATYNLIGIALAATGLLHPVAAALLMVCSSAIVSWRAARLTNRDDEACACPPAALPAGNAPSPLQMKRQVAYGILLAMQGPFVAWLGHLSFSAGAATVIGFAFGGIALVRLHTRNSNLQSLAAMTVAMLALGNWGMLLGWWMDAGFRPVMQTGVCLCCNAHAYFALNGWHVPWMYVGMVAFGVPPMLWSPPSRLNRLSRWIIGLLATVGMILGMSFGASIALKWAGPLHPQQFLIALGGMTLGMLAGMIFFCELARVLTRRSFKQKGQPTRATPASDKHVKLIKHNSHASEPT